MGSLELSILYLLETTKSFADSNFRISNSISSMLLNVSKVWKQASKPLMSRPDTRSTYVCMSVSELALLAALQ